MLELDDNLGQQLAGAILDYGVDWAPTAIVQLALAAAVMAVARRYGITPREVLERELRAVVSDERWHGEIVPKLHTRELNTTLAVIASLRRN